MTVLSALLPGVRAVRAPLAAGFILFLSIWLAVEPSVPRRSGDATGIWASLVRLDTVASGAVVVAMVSFAAYVAGSLFLIVSTSVVPDRVSRVLMTVGRDMTAMEGGPLHRLLPSVDEAGAFHAHISERVAIETDDDRTITGPATLRVISSLAYLDWPYLSLSVVGTQPHLYAEIDRFESEADFRAALIGPIVALACVVAFRLDALWYSALVLLGGLGIAAALALGWRQGRLRANSTLASGIQAGLIEPASLQPTTIAQVLQEVRDAAMRPEDSLSTAETGQRAD